MTFRGDISMKSGRGLAVMVCLVVLAAGASIALAATGGPEKPLGSMRVRQFAGPGEVALVPPHNVGVGSRSGGAMVSSRTMPAPHGGVVILKVRAPASVRSAGRRELDRWYFGRRVASEAGCAACHRIGESGNAGPGKPLTQIGAHLSKQELEKVLLDAPAPMPSFRSMPRDKLEPLVFFIALLRGGHRMHG
jgi:mono/diheme cytochrome c family protein